MKLGISMPSSSLMSVYNLNHREHENADVIIQRIFQNAAGYHADRDANDLREDTLFKTVLEKEVLASQPKLSRVNNLSDKKTMKQLQNANNELLEKIHQKMY